MGCLYVQAKELETELDAALIDVEDHLAEESCKDHDVNSSIPGKHLYENKPEYQYVSCSMLQSCNSIQC